MHSLGRAFASALARAEPKAIVVFVEGELGAGKTTLVAGILFALGAQGPVRSPTYTLIETYEAAGRQLHHMDLYRLTDPQEVEPLGIRDLLLPSSVLLIEWPSRAAGMLPLADLELLIEYGEGAADVRVVRFTPNTQCGNKLVEAILVEAPELSVLSP